MNEPFDPKKSALYLYYERQINKILEGRGTNYDIEALPLLWEYLEKESEKSE